MKSSLIYSLMQVLVSQVNSQAPGDADSFCLSLSGSVTPPAYPPNSKILMDSYQYIHLLPTLPGTLAVWQQVDADNRTDSSGGRTNWFQASSFACRQRLSSCYFNTGGQNNWLISQHISRVVNGSLLPQVSVQIEFQLIGCTFGCQVSFLLEVWETSAIDRNAARITSNYRRVVRVAPTTDTGSNVSENASIPVDFFDPAATGFYVAIVDENTCIALTRVIVFYHVCPEMILDLIRYPETLSPPINELQPRLLDGQCVDKASGELQGANPRLSCIQGGKWGVVLEGTGCRCDAGFMHIEETEECTRCPMGEYVSPSNLTCQPCPSNTQKDVPGAAECKCLPGYFRAPDENADFGCTYLRTDETTPSFSNESNGTLHDGIIAAIIAVVMIILLVICIPGAIFTLVVIRYKNKTIIKTRDSPQDAVKGTGLSLTILSSILAVHTWRLYRIFNHFSDPGKISDKYLVAIVSAVSSSSIFISLLWTARRFSEEEEQCTIDLDTRSKLVIRKCIYNVVVYYLLFCVYFGLIFVILIIAVVYSLLIKQSVPKQQKQFRRKNIICLSYCYFLIVLLGFPAFKMGYISNDLRFLFVTAMLLHLSMIMSPLLLLFTSPVINAWREVQKKQKE